MAEKIMHEVLINRKWISVLQDYFRMKKLEYHFIRNNHDELKPYEATYGRTLTKMDAIVMSPLSKDEITELLTTCDTNEELNAYKKERNETRLKIYYENYGKNA